MDVRDWRWLRLERAEVVFAVLKTLAFVGAVAALFLAPVRPEHQVHLPPLLAFFLLYHLLLYGAAFRWRQAIRAIFLLVLACDLLFVFFLVWFTGGLDSHFYLLFYLIITMSAYFFGFPIGLGTAAVSGLLYTAATFTSDPEAVHLGYLTSRIALFGLFGVSVGFLSERDRRYRGAIEQLNRQLQAAQAELLQAERLSTIGAMAAKVAHEIRNPLGAISLSLELLEDSVQAGEGVALIAAIKADVERLNAVIEEYLRFARLPRPHLRAEQVNDTVQEFVTFHMEAPVGSGIEVQLDLASDLPPILMDRHQVRQVLMNLVRNACEAMPQGGTLRLGTRRVTDGVELIVEDTGEGIRPEDLPRIFDPFFTTKAQGTGLGLAIARQIVDEHGGSITCASTPGKGTRFAIWLPIARGGGLL